jgi:hypothetical protein
LSSLNHKPNLFLETNKNLMLQQNISNSVFSQSFYRPNKKKATDKSLNVNKDY